jgi:hypothetical protein
MNWVHLAQNSDQWRAFMNEWNFLDELSHC